MAWRRLLANLPPQLAQALTLHKATISRTSGTMTIHFHADRLLQSDEEATLRRAMVANFPELRTAVRVDFPTLRSAVADDIEVARVYVLSHVLSQHPAAKPFLQRAGAVWTRADDALTVSVESAEVADFLTQSGVGKHIERCLSDAFTLKVHVVFRIQDGENVRLQRLEAKRAHDDAMLQATARVIEMTRNDPPPESSGTASFGAPITESITSMGCLTEESGRVAVRGEVVKCELRDAKNGTMKILICTLTDYEGSTSLKAFLTGKRGKNAMSVERQTEAIQACVQEGRWITALGDYKYDEFSHTMVLVATSIQPASAPVRVDTAAEKRVELHAHTQMSTMDACVSPTALIQQAAKWGHPAIAITDHGVVQSFPEAFDAAKKAKIKLIPGCEGYLIEDRPTIVTQADARAVATARYVVVDVETTGLNTSTDQIIEIGAVCYQDGQEVAEFSELVDPVRPLPPKITELTGITDAMLQGKRTIASVIRDFAAFAEGAVLVAHNASFDMRFIGRAYEAAELPFAAPVLDTLAMARSCYPTLKSHKLGALCKHLGISLKDAHRAVHDARATAQLLMAMIDALNDDSMSLTLNQLNDRFEIDKGGDSYHIILLATSRKGMTNLNRLISESHLHYFHRTPRMPRSLIAKYREGLIIGSACEAGELYRAAVAGASDEQLAKIAAFYDYLEIQPVGNNAFLVREGRLPDEEAIRDLNRRIVALGRSLGKPVVATGDVHFLNPLDSMYRAILMASRGFEDVEDQPPLYFRTTDDMLQAFAYLGKAEAKRVVIDAPNEIASRVETIENLFMRTPDGGETFQPFWPEAEQELRDLCDARAKSIFGEDLPEIVQKRMDKELGAICGYGFSTLYMIAVKLVRKSLSDGYIVGSRGSVGSSFVAKLAGITEVDALPPYYACPACKHNEFDVPKQYTCGLDLPPKNCPICGTGMIRDGFNIPFEVFLGFNGDKVPDIDLNFSGVYQPRAHAYVKELFGAPHVFRAGTIGTVAEKTAYGYVLKYAETRGLNYTNAEKERLARGITGVKRTTGQHPAGMVVLPKGYEIYEFTAIQHPADDMTTETVTTHYDFSSMHDVLVKLDILGHDDPTMLRNLQDLTGIAPQAVPLDDPEVYRNILSLFSTPEALGITEAELGVATGTLGIPEFGTPFVRGMLVETRPRSMEELIRISGLSHGTDVWLGNVQEILRSGQADLRTAICTRDDIMNQLIDMGVEAKTAFDTMEFVRKGKAAKGGGLKPNMLSAMQAHDVPQWFIDSCNKIGYMFPKAHAVAYVVMALRIAYFKIYYPLAYYTCYLQRNADAFDGTTMVGDLAHIRARMDAITAMDKEERDRKDDEYTVLEVLAEMNLRGVRMRPVDLYASDAEKFLSMADETILPPLSSLPGLGATAAQSLSAIRAKGRFLSEEDMVRRKVGRSVVDILRKSGCLGDMPKTSQVSLFDL